MRSTNGKARTKHRRVIKAEVCPRCGSTNIKLSSKFDIWLMPKQYVCYDCGYTGPVILEFEEDQSQTLKNKENGQA